MADLITLDEYKLAKGLVKTDQDDRIQQLITNISGFIQSYTKRKFAAEDANITEVIALDYDTDTIYLQEYPISEVTSVTAIDPIYWDSTIHFPVNASTDYIVDTIKGKLIKLSNNFWPQGQQAVIVEYKVQGSDIDSIPPEIKQVTIDLVTYYLKEEWSDKSLRGATVTNVNHRGGGNTDSFPTHIQKVLDLYAR